MTTSDTTFSLRLNDGQETPPITISALKSAAEQLKAADRANRGAPPMKSTKDDVEVENHVYTVAADELRQFIERFEQLDAEKKDAAESQKEVMLEAKGRGYDTKAIRKIVAMRKRSRDELAEEEAILDLYKAALGMK